MSECRSDRGYYSQKKMKYLPVLTLRLQGIFSDTIMHGVKWFHVSCGVSQIVLVPVGPCTCSHIETPAGLAPADYLKAGEVVLIFVVYSQLS